ncbi:Txe/YoeB family addiction module toxin [Sphingomonas sp.]|uniref:Txe/YoeB family addiction module toxin n=1 Tax=Sphingomonas sp. TaxID=28214 RepID=UPI0035C82F30
MKISFTERAWAQYTEWQGDDGRTLVKINELIRDCMRDPFRGLGKPEPLGGNLSGWWSRRIGWRERLVYRVVRDGEEQVLQVAQCRYHY